MAAESVFAHSSTGVRLRIAASANSPRHPLETIFRWSLADPVTRSTARVCNSPHTRARSWM